MAKKVKPSAARDGETGEASKSLLARLEAKPPESTALAKAYFIGETSGSQSNALVEQERMQAEFMGAGALAVTYDPTILACIYENSSNLRPNVDAYIVNIDSYGHHFLPVIDLDVIGADEKIRDAIRAERRYEKKRPANRDTALKSQDLPGEPSDADVAARKAELRIAMRAERSDLELFFDSCCPTMPFSGPEGLRGRTRQDIEVFGYGYWEVLRNGLNEMAHLNYVEGRTVRLMPADREVTEVQMWQRISSLEATKVTVKKRFRNYVQLYEATSRRFVYYKEFGDPRVTSSRTGRKYQTPEELEATEPGTPQATELIAFKINSVRSVYGAPRWVGALLAVLGTRQSEEVNFLYFENRSIPPMAIIVTGGRLVKESAKKLEDHIATQIKGKRNFHKLLVIEGEPSSSQDMSVGPNNGKMKITLQPLTDAQQKDALFQGYDERNADKVGQAFRLPRLLRGDVRDFNRSTAEASVDFAEIQVFGPIRQQFDWLMNTIVLPELGAKYHTFRSNAPTVRDPDALSDIIYKLVTASVLTPEEARALARGCFNEELPKIKAAWTQQPIALTLAGRPIDDDLNTPVDEAGEYASAGINEFSAPGAGGTQQAMGVDQTKRKRKLSAKAMALVKIQKQLIDAERSEWKKTPAETITMPADLFRQCFISA